MKCIVCRIRKWYHWLLGRLMFSGDGIRLTSRVVATLIKDGKVIRRFEGSNKWNSTGLNSFMHALRIGGSGTEPLMVKNLSLGSECSDTSYTFIGGTEKSSTNETVSTTQVKFTAEWPAAGAINNICQAAVMMNTYSGGTDFNASYYNFGTSFDKPDGVSLKIEWTTSLTS